MSPSYFYFVLHKSPKLSHRTNAPHLSRRSTPSSWPKRQQFEPYLDHSFLRNHLCLHRHYIMAMSCRFPVDQQGIAHWCHHCSVCSLWGVWITCMSSHGSYITTVELGKAALHRQMLTTKSARAARGVGKGAARQTMRVCVHHHPGWAALNQNHSQAVFQSCYLHERNTSKVLNTKDSDRI